MQRWSFQPYWLKVDIEDSPRQDNKLMLTSHGKSLVIGSVLSPDERLDFARALETALYKLRQPPPASSAAE